MLHNYLKIALRNLWKTKGITAINVIGLSVGLACFALVGLFVLDEWTFDRFHPKADFMYRVVQNSFKEDGSIEEGRTHHPMPLAEALKADFPDVVNTMRTRGFDKNFVRSARLTAKEAGILFADPSIFEMFFFPLAFGNPGEALKQINSAVLSQNMALKYFGEQNPIGRTFEIQIYGKFEPFTVTGVLEKIPSNSTAQFEILLPFAKFQATPNGQKGVNNWHRSSFQTFAELRPGSNLANDPARLLQFYQKYYPNEEKELRQKGQWKGAGAPFSISITPLRAMPRDPMYGGTNPKYAWVLLAIGGMILLIACINFMTLAIGRSAGRAAEIGVRKVIGAERRQLVGQFLSEAVLLSAISMLLAIGLVILLLPLLNALTDKKMVVSVAVFPEIKWLVPALTLLAGLLAGFYPALVLSGLKPLMALQQKLRLTGSNFFTKSLVTFQFVLSVGLIACTLTMNRQLDFLRERNPGFNREHVLVVKAEGVDGKKLLQHYRQELGNRQEFAGFTGSDMSFGEEEGWSESGFDYQGTIYKAMYEYAVDAEFLPVLGMNLIAGRNFDFTRVADSTVSVIVNEALVRDFGWANPVGEPLTGYNEREPTKTPIVIGVVQDFNYQSFHGEVKPMMFIPHHKRAIERILVRVRGGENARALALLQEHWAQTVPDLPFQYSFLEDDLNQFYRTAARWGKLVWLASSIALFLACLGLFGLTALAVVNRTKEIGIRKVLGASVPGITALLAKDFLKLVVLAILIASPLAYLSMRQWLNDFAYRIDMQWWMFAAAGLAAIAIAFLTVGFQGVKAALSNPVKSLRRE